ncbi:MAG: GspH/FimT family pseudopilin [Pacificimonas sp.]|jgi:general secretion pathway protein H|nr:GspH/FimT family pseudopilin [Pacificimonas sp.]
MRRARSNGEGGFTLVEIMVVLVIIGLAAAVAAIGFGSGGNEARTEAERLGARLLAARDHALFSQRETAAVVDQSGYRFEERLRGDWQPLATRALKSRGWDEARPAGADLPLRIRFDAVGLAQPTMLRLRAANDTATLSVDAAGGVRVEG